MRIHPLTHFGLSLLRIGYHGTVFFLVLDLWNFREVAFFGHGGDAIPILLSALFVNALLAFGLATRPLLIGNWLLLRMLFFHCLDPYTADESVANFSLILMFAPRPRALSLDSRREGVSEPGAPVPSWFAGLVFTGLVLLYEDSVYWKLHSEVWRTGAVVWLSADLPHFTRPFVSALPGGPSLARALAWTVLAYELLFPLVLFRPLRGVIVTVGVLVHLGSAVLYPLPQFAGLLVSLLLFFAPWDSWLPRLARAPVETAGTEPRPQGRAALLAWALAVLMAAGQVRLHWQPAGNAMTRLLGIYTHQIFVDELFRLPGPLFRLTTEVSGRRLEIPSFDEQGHPIVCERYWKMLGFLVRAGQDPRPFLTRYALGWFRMQGLRPRPVYVSCKDVSFSGLELDPERGPKIARRPFLPCLELDFRPRPRVPHPSTEQGSSPQRP